MRRLLEDIAIYLNTIGIGTPGQTVFIGNMPNTPVNALGIYSSGGEVSVAGSPVYRPGFQLLLRRSSGDFANASNLADYLFQVLDDKWNVLDRVRGRIIATSAPGVFFRDDSGNLVFSLNFQVITVITTISTPAAL